MKSILLLVFVFCSVKSFTQCDLSFGNFETWVDQTSFLEEDFETDFPDSSYLSVPELNPTIRAFLLFFLVDVLSIIDVIPAEDVQVELLGFKRNDDAHSGSYSLQMGGDTLLGFSDLAYFNACEGSEAPNFLSYYYKHMGTEKDTFLLIATLGENEDSLASPLNGTISEDIGVYFTDTLISETTDEEWQWRQLPAILNNDTISLDSILLYLIRVGPAEKESYFLIDDIEWDIESSTHNALKPISFNLGQSLDSEYLFLSLEDPNFNFISYQIFDVLGRNISPITYQWQETIDISMLPKGNFFFHIKTKKGVFTKQFVRF